MKETSPTKVNQVIRAAFSKNLGLNNIKETSFHNNYLTVVSKSDLYLFDVENIGIIGSLSDRNIEMVATGDLTDSFLISSVMYSELILTADPSSSPTMISIDRLNCLIEIN